MLIQRNIDGECETIWPDGNAVRSRYSVITKHGGQRQSLKMLKKNLKLEFTQNKWISATIWDCILILIKAPCDGTVGTLLFLKYLKEYMEINDTCIQELIFDKTKISRIFTLNYLYVLLLWIYHNLRIYLYIKICSIDKNQDI